MARSKRVPSIGDLVILRLDVDESFQDYHGLGMITEIIRTIPFHDEGIAPMLISPSWYRVKWLKSTIFMRFQADDLKILAEVGNASA